jgi:glycine/D-amino acid oxidase-like deaminating enzyme
VERADVVIVGGGVHGASIAYHLASKGVRDVVVLERERLGVGSTSRNAGGVRLQFSTEINVRLSQRSLPHWERFNEEMGVDVGFHQVGYLILSLRSSAPSRSGHASAYPRAVSIRGRFAGCSRRSASTTFASRRSVRRMATSTRQRC